MAFERSEIEGAGLSKSLVAIGTIQRWSGRALEAVPHLHEAVETANDPSQRLMVVVNYNMDIGDYMEHSSRGWYAVDPTNEAFKFGVNYFIYGLTR